MKTHEHEAPYTAGEVIADMQARGLIPSGPAPDRRRIAEAVLRVLAGTCWGLAGLMTAWLIATLLTR